MAQSRDIFAQKRSNMSEKRNDNSKTSSDDNIVTSINLIPEVPNSAWSGFPSDTWSNVANVDFWFEPMMFGDDSEKWLASWTLSVLTGAFWFLI